MVWARMSAVTGFATGMIAGALWLLFFIGLGLTARKSPGHPFRSIRRFRSTGRSLEIDVPSALKNAPPESSEVRLVSPEELSPRGSRHEGGVPGDKPLRRPDLRPVPDFAEPTLQVDPLSFFEPESPFVRPRAPERRADREEASRQALFRPTLVEEEPPALVTAAAGAKSARGAGSRAAGARPMPPMMTSGQPPRPSKEPADRPRPVGSGAGRGPGMDGPYSPAGAVMPPVSSKSSSPPAKAGRFGKNKARGKGAKPLDDAATPPIAPPAAAVPAAVEQKKREKKGLLKRGKVEPYTPVPPRAAVRPPGYAVPPPARPSPSAAAPAARPRFNAPFNYVPPGAFTPSSARSSYPTVSAPPSTPRTWQPPSSFSPPASPSFSSWGPRPAEPESERQAEAGVERNAPPPATRPVDVPAPNSKEGQAQEGSATEAPPWVLNLTAGNGEPRKDPALPEVIDLSMFRDPNSTEETPEDQTQRGAEPEEPNRAWPADEAWPSPAGDLAASQQSSAPTSGETTVSMEPPWFGQERSEAGQPSMDLSSPDMPWPGETRRPAQRPQWGEETPADDPWSSPGRQPARPAADPWSEPVREPQPSPAPDPWAGRNGRRGRPRKRQAADEALSALASRTPAAPPEPPLPPAPVPPPMQHPADAAWQQDPWREQRADRHAAEPSIEREPHSGRVAEPHIPEEPQPSADAPAQVRTNGAGPADAGARENSPLPEEPSWKPIGVDPSQLGEAAWRQPVTTKIAPRLKAAKEAIKVENGLAYVLVDDEGRPVLR